MCIEARQCEYLAVNCEMNYLDGIHPFGWKLKFRADRGIT